MSWTGFQKAVNRATTQLMQTTGAVEKTVYLIYKADAEFDQQEARFKLFEDRIEGLHRECRGYLDAVRKLTVAQVGIADTLLQFCNQF